MDEHRWARGADRGLGTGDVSVDLDTAKFGAAAGEEDAIGRALEGPVGIVGVGGEEAIEGLDAIVVIVENVALDAEAIGEEIGNLERGADGLAERFEDAAEGCWRDGFVGDSWRSGENHGGLHRFGQRVFGLFEPI